MIKFSAKTKSIIFVVTLMFFMFLSQIYQNSIFYKTYLEQIKLSYSNSFENFYKSFIENEFSRYDFIASHFSQSDVLDSIKRNENEKIMRDVGFFYTQFKSQDRFLKQMYFIDRNLKFKISKNSISYDRAELERYKLYKDRINYTNNTAFDVVVKDKSINFILVFGIFEADELLGFVKVVLSSDVLLSNLEHFDGSRGFILVDSESIRLDNEIIHINNSQNEIVVKDKIYTIKQYDIKNIESKVVANGIFLLDITDKNEFYSSAINKNIVFGICFFVFAILALNFTFTFLITKLERLNLTLNKKVKIAIQKERQKDKLLIYQSKLAGTGEMIANIAHQWRQPLMQLSSINMLLEALSERDELDRDKFDLKLKESNKIISYMSSTIDDFRNFYKPDKAKEMFYAKESILNSLAIIRSSLLDNEIKFKLICKDEIKIYGYKNEFSQAILNILSNSKDALLNVSSHIRKIRIIVAKDSEFITIFIQDNAGGIDDDIIEKIFDPYFSTKHSFLGTGIGLYMSRMIIENNMQGQILVCNKALNGALGAMFAIRLKVAYEL